MWFTLDIGNSQAKGGLFAGRRLVRTFRLGLKAGAPVDAWKDALARHLEGSRPTRTGVASVVPAATSGAQEALRQLTGRPADIVHPAMRLPFALAYETPHTLGTDRLAAAAAAWTLHRPPAAPERGVVAVDAGTAVTYDVVDGAGTYRGGAISAGPRLVRRALTQGTAQLPAVPLALPPRTIGRSTREALQSGIAYGFLDGARGMLDRIERELDAAPVVVVTGGHGALLHRHLGTAHCFAPHLVLEGIRVLMEMNSSGRASERRDVS